MICDMSQIHATTHGGTDERISAAVRGLIAQRRTSAAEVAMAVGVSRAALYRKLSTESPWQADEVDRLARFFGVTRDSLYEGRAEFSHAHSATTDQKVRGSNPFGCTDRRRRSDRRRHVYRRRSTTPTVVPLRHLSVVPPLVDDAIAS